MEENTQKSCETQGNTLKSCQSEGNPLNPPCNHHKVCTVTPREAAPSSWGHQLLSPAQAELSPSSCGRVIPAQGAARPSTKPLIRATGAFLAAPSEGHPQWGKRAKA